jgi:hypothetical protein
MAARAVLQLLQEQNERAESESMRLREKMERDREQARNQAVQFAQAGFSIGDIEKAVPHLDLQGYTLAKMVADKQKRDKQAAEAEAEGAAQGQSAQSQLAQLLQNTGGDASAINPGLLDQIKLGLLQGGESSPASFVDRAAAVEQANAQAAQRSRIASLMEYEAKERFKAELKDSQGRGLASYKSGLRLEEDSVLRGRDRYDAVEAQSREARYDAEASSLAGTMRSTPGSLSGHLIRIQSNLEDPALEMPIILGRANKVYAASQDVSGLQEDFRAQGYSVPPALARDVVNGKANIDEFTGLISRDYGERADDMRQGRATSMYELIEMREVATRIATGPLARKSATARLAWVTEQSAKYQIGTADPLYVEFRNRRDRLVAAMAKASFTGTLSDQERRFTENLVAQPRMLAGNASGTGLAAQIDANLNALEAGIASKYRSAIPRGVFSDEQLRRVFNERKKSHAEQFRTSYLDAQYPPVPQSDGWMRVR